MKKATKAAVKALNRAADMLDDAVDAALSSSQWGDAETLKYYRAQVLDLLLCDGGESGIEEYVKRRMEGSK